MKKGLLFGMVLSTVVIFAKPVAAQDRGFGIGIMFGAPTGLSAKLWTSRVNAFDFGLGLPLGSENGGSRFHFHMDYLWHSFNVISSTERFPIYYGFGGRYNGGGNGYDGSFGIRGVIGIAWFPHSTPIDIFAELAPVLQLTSSVGLGLEGGIGIRYFFE